MGKVRKAQIVKENKGDHAQNIDFPRGLVYIHKSVAVTLAGEIEIQAVKPQKGQKQPPCLGRLHFGHILAEIGPGEVIADGVELRPPEGVKLHIGVEKRGQDGQGEEGSDKHLFLFFAGAAMVHHVQEGDHEKQAGVHLNIPGVAVAVEVDNRANDLSGSGEAVFMKTFQEQTGNTAQKIDQIDPHIAQIIPGRQFFPVAQVAGEHDIQGNTDGEQNPQHHHQNVAGCGKLDIVQAGIVKPVHTGNAQQRRTADQIQVEIAFFFSHGLLL